MPNTHAAKIENGRVVASIVGYAKWASERFGGEWVDTGPETYGDVWLYVDGKFVRDKPYDNWVWDDDEQDFVPPVPKPKPVEHHNWWWVQDEGVWVQFHEDYTGPFPPPAA